MAMCWRKDAFTTELVVTVRSDNRSRESSLIKLDTEKNERVTFARVSEMCFVSAWGFPR